MDKNMKEAFVQSGTTGKVIIGFCLIVMIFLGVFAWLSAEGNAQGNRLIMKLTELIEEQKQLEFFKKCVHEDLGEATIYYNDELIPEIGKILTENNIPFPQGLNVKFMKYREKMEAIKDCLIFPDR